MRKIPGFLVILGSLTAVPAVGAQTVIELRVGEAVERGLEQNEQLRIARAEAEAAYAGFRQVRAGRLPSVLASGSYSRLGQIPEFGLELPGLDTTLSAFAIPRDQVYSELSIEQPLFTGFRLRQQSRAAAGRARAAALLARQAEADVALEIRAAYWGLWQALAVHDAHEAAFATVDAHVRRVEALLSEGAALRLDLLDARTRRAEVQLELLDARNALRVARLELNRLIGLPLESDLVPVEAPGPLPELPELPVLVAAVLASRPQLAALAEEVRALDAEVAAAGGAWLPELAAFGRYIYARPSPVWILAPGELHGHWQLGLTARWSLFDASRAGATAAARARRTAARARLADATAAIEVEVHRRYLNARRAEEALTAAEQHLAAAREMFQVVDAMFREGAALPSQVLDAEQVLRAATARLARSDADRAIAHAAVRNALGEVE